MLAEYEVSLGSTVEIISLKVNHYPPQKIEGQILNFGLIQIKILIVMFLKLYTSSLQLHSVSWASIGQFASHDSRASLTPWNAVNESSCPAHAMFCSMCMWEVLKVTLQIVVGFPLASV